MRGVPRARRAISVAPASSIGARIQDARGAQDDLPELFQRIELKVVEQAEAVAQGRREASGPRGRANQRKPLERNVEWSWRTCPLSTTKSTL